MEELTVEKIIHSLRLKATMINSILFTFLGLLISISPIIYLKVLNVNTIIGVSVCVVCFGVPFCGFFGLIKFIKAKRIFSALKHMNFSVFTDNVESKRMMFSGIRSEDTDKYCQIQFEKYSTETGKYFTITRRMFENTKEGEKFYLLFIDNIKDTFAIFPAKSFKLSKELNSVLM